MTAHHRWATVDLWTAVDGLVKPGKVAIVRDATPWVHDVGGALACNVAEYLEIQEIRAEIRAAGRAFSMSSGHGTTPSLWQQACDAVMTGSESDGTGGTTPARERSPADLALMQTIHGICRRVSKALDRPGTLLASAMPAHLRMVAGRVTRGTLAETDVWTQRVRFWTEQLATHLQAAVEQPARAVYLRNTCCPECGIAQVVQPVAAEANIVRPALYVTFVGDMVRAAECLACGRVWWRGDIAELAEQLGLDPTLAKGLTL